MNHRVKNSLAMVSGMLRLQAAADDDPELTRRLEEAAARIAAIARAHERLYQGSAASSSRLRSAIMLNVSGSLPPP